jgi:antitoxin component YwqK of YwqJK toxin-antitoxin module
MKYLFLILFFASKLLGQTFAQNKLNDRGLRDGLWIEEKQYGTVEAYYSDGKLNGFYRSYSRANKMRLSALGYYENGKMAGDWYFIDDKNHLFMVCKALINNKVAIRLYSKKTIPKSSGYLRLFYENGKLKEEGKAIFDDVEIDFYRVDLWKYYDKNGTLVKQENYTKPKIAD